MPPEPTKRPPPAAWRAAGVWMVMIALALATLGIVLAVRQTHSVTALLMEQGQRRSLDIAIEARRLFHEELDAAVRLIPEGHALGDNLVWVAPPGWPRWLDALYVWDGRVLRTLYSVPAHSEAVNALVRQVAVDRSPTVETTEAGTRVYYVTLKDRLLVFARVQRGNQPILVMHVVPERLRAVLAEPLISPGDGVELAPAEAATESPWTQPMYSALRFWVLRPTARFLETQRRIVLGQTTAYVGLTALALVTLLAGMWFLMRVAQREIRLAEMKANFVADVSHELKTPLAVIRLYAETLQSGRVHSEEKQQDYFQIISRESTRLTNLINTILDFARIESGRKEYTLKPTDVAHVVRECYEAYQPELDRHHFQHHLSIAASLPPVDADRDAITQVMFNLMNNALKYSGDEKYLAIELTTDTRRGRHGVLISVHDRGIGIRPDDRAQLFEGFFRAPDERVREQGGTGLGLALVKHIVDAHHGSIDVESRLVKGTTFRVFLPASDALPPEVA